MGRFSPRKHQTEFFGFHALSGKITSFLGPIVLGTVAQLAHSQRAGMATVIAFFVVGGVILALVAERRGIAEAGATNAASA
jgi:MFS transporter, UMF1 family